MDTNLVTVIDKRGRSTKLPLLSKKEVAEELLDRVSALLKKTRGK